MSIPKLLTGLCPECGCDVRLTHEYATFAQYTCVHPCMGAVKLSKHLLRHGGATPFKLILRLYGTPTVSIVWDIFPDGGQSSGCAWRCRQEIPLHTLLEEVRRFPGDPVRFLSAPPSSAEIFIEPLALLTALETDGILAEYENQS